MAWVFDHVSGKKLRGFNLLTLGWTDGFSFIPVAFNMLSSAKAASRIIDIKEGIDKRTNGYKNRMAAIVQKPDAAITMIKAALETGIEAGYVLMDTWFTNEPFINQIKGLGLEVIGMLKDNHKMAVVVSDNGQPYLPAGKNTKAQRSGIGLRTMQQRAALIGATIDFHATRYGNTMTLTLKI